VADLIENQEMKRINGEERALTPVSTAAFETNDNNENNTVDHIWLHEYEPPDSLWRLISEICIECELDVIKKRIGTTIVEQSIDLHGEIDTLLDIWRDYSAETMSVIESNNHPRPKATNSLHEPANARQTLKKEIGLFVSQLRDQYNGNDELFRAQMLRNKHDVNVIDYALNGEANISRHASRSSSYVESNGQSRRASSVANTQTPLMHNASSRGDGLRSRQRIRYRSESRFEPTYKLDIISSDESVVVDEQKLNYLQIDDIAERLAELLTAECAQMLVDIELIHECLENEREFRYRSTQPPKLSREPSIGQLREERRKLEEDLLCTKVKNQAQISRLSTASDSTRRRSLLSSIGYSTQEHSNGFETLTKNSKANGKVADKPLRNDSASSSSSSSNSFTLSPSEPKPTSAQKFRQKVFSSRETE
jgi:hypothetical protein